MKNFLLILFMIFSSSLYAKTANDCPSCVYLSFWCIDLQEELKLINEKDTSSPYAWAAYNYYKGCAQISGDYESFKQYHWVMAAIFAPTYKLRYYALKHAEKFENAKINNENILVFQRFEEIALNESKQ